MKKYFLHLRSFRQTPGLCGAAALKIVLDYYGMRIPEKNIAKICKSTPEKGTKAEHMIRYAKKLGFQAYIKDLSTIQNIRNLVYKKRIPAIVDFFAEDDGHYAVVCDIDSENIYLEDPERGHVRAMKIKDFMRVWFDFRGNTMKTKNDLILRRLIIIHK